MLKKYIISIVTIWMVITTGTYSNCISNQKTTIKNNNNLSKDIWINNLNNKDIKIKVTNIKIEEEKINVGELYNAFAIVTMDITNYGQNNVELANLNVYPYQGEKPTKYFVTTAENNINGFLGNLNTNESKTIKMGVTLHNIKDPIKLEFSNIEDFKNENVVKTIKIK